MSTEVPLVITIIIVATKALATMALWYAVYRFGRRGEGGPTIGAIPFTIASVIWFGWAIASTVIPPGRFFGQYGVPILFSLSLIAGFVLYWAWPGLRGALNEIPQPWLIGVQVSRVIGGSFLAVMAMGNLPGAFALPAGIGDVITGIAAAFVAFAIARGIPNARGMAIAWNIFGVLDLVVAVGMGFVTSPLAARFIHIVPDSAILADIPLTLIPTFLVPLALWMHALSLRALLRQPAASAGPRERAVA